MKFQGSPSIGSQVIPCGQMDGQVDKHEEANSCQPQCEHA